jgi:ABC-2 type transport system ATP-binding protein
VRRIKRGGVPICYDSTKQKAPRVTQTPIVELRNVSKTYAGAERPAVDRVDLSIVRGCLFGLLGPNGAGKTTLMSMLCGLLRPNTGEIFLDGRNVREASPQQWRRIGLVPQDLAIYPGLTARENLAYFGGIQGLSGTRLTRRIDFCLDTAGLTALADRRIDTFSGGLKRRLNLVIALIHEPELLILDEPTVGIDPQSRRFIHDNLRRLNAEGLTIIYTSHYMEEVERLCHELAIIDHGRIIAAGSVDQILDRIPHGMIQLRVQPRLPESVRARLRTLDGVDRADFDGDSIMLESRNPQATFTRALELLAHENLRVTSASLGATNLEQVFLALTGTTLRDSP